MASFDAMIDIETLGTDHNSSIIAVGVSVFDGRWFETKEVTLKPDYSRASQDTLSWWREQDGGVDYLETLDNHHDFTTLEDAWRDLKDVFHWYDRKRCRDTAFWCRGMDFDFTLLTRQLKSVPWKFYQCNDLRTLHKVWGNPAGYQAPAQVAHRAGEDAEAQNKLLQEIKADISRVKRGHML